MLRKRLLHVCMLGVLPLHWCAMTVRTTIIAAVVVQKCFPGFLRDEVEVHVLHYVQSVRACLEEEDPGSLQMGPGADNA